MRVEEKCESEIRPACRQRDAEQGPSFPNRAMTICWHSSLMAGPLRECGRSLRSAAAECWRTVLTAIFKSDRYRAAGLI